jgi:hypothetical protein
MEVSITCVTLPWPAPLHCRKRSLLATNRFAETIEATADIHVDTDETVLARRHISRPRAYGPSALGTFDRYADPAITLELRRSAFNVQDS